MSEQNVSAPVAPQADTSAQPSAAQNPAEGADKEPSWLKGRLDRERDSVTKTLLRELGVTDVKDAKAAVEELKKLRDAQRSEEEKLRLRNAELEPAAKQLESYRAFASAQAEEALSSLTEEQKSVVMSLAGDDPIKLITAVRAFKSMAPATAPAAKPLAPPASTSAASPSPPPAATATENHRATYERLKATNPLRAAEYRLRHLHEISSAYQK